MEKNIAQALDMEVVLNIIYHIENPCTVEVGNETKNIRNFYLKCAKENILSTLTNPFAREFLEETLRKYQ
ncbi:MAG: hypothetical protein ABII03_00545 [Nanoarchaeota archaeon]